MAEDVKVGDVVQLKSGGPKMTIEQIGDFNRAYIDAKCVWFNETKRESGLLELSSLTKGADPESIPNLQLCALATKHLYGIRSGRAGYAAGRELVTNCITAVLHFLADRTADFRSARRCQQNTYTDAKSYPCGKAKRMAKGMILIRVNCTLRLSRYVSSTIRYRSTCSFVWSMM